MNKKFKIPWSSRSHFFTDKEISQIIKVLKNADVLSQGMWLERFEKKFLKFIKSDGKAYGVTSGASAIEIAAALLNLKKNDEIIIPSHTYCATALPFTRYNCKIKWADINSETFCVDPLSIKKLITKKTKAVVAVHLYGSPCDIIEIKKICKKNKILLIEDCAQSLGSKIDNRHVGTFGDLSIFSFHQQKNMTTLGEGGMLVVNNKKFKKFVYGLRHNGHRNYLNKKKYWKPAMVNVYEDIKGVTPFNFPMTELQACAGYLLLDRVNLLNRKRNIRANIIRKKLEKFNFIKFQKNIKNYSNSYHLLPVYFDKKIVKFNRDKFIERMSKVYKIQLIVQYHPLDKYHYFKNKYPSKEKLDNTYNFYNNMFSIPFHEWMSEKDFNYLTNSLKIELKRIVKL